MTEKKKGKFLPIADFYKALEKDNKLIALASREQVRTAKEPGRRHKAPARTWDKTPNDYKGFNDEKYGTAILCDYIPSLKRHLAVIDLDPEDLEKEKKGIPQVPLKVLKSVCLPIMSQTYTLQTPSGGVHIYLLSKKKPIQSQPKINIDYQTNTGKSKGKYVVSNFRWDKHAEHKENYKRLPESVDQIALIGNADDVLQDIIEKLTDAGHIKTAGQEHQKSIAEVFKPYIKNRSSVNNFSLAIAGYLRKKGFKKEAAEDIIKEIFRESGDLQTRLGNVKQTYERPIKNIEGWQHIKDVLGKEDLQRLDNLTTTKNGDIKAKILTKLGKNKTPTSKEVADYVNNNLELFKNLDTFRYYERLETGQIVEVDERRIIKFLNNDFGYNVIDTKTCMKVLDFITRPIRKNYNLVEFKNGILNTKTKEFKKDKKEFNETPKVAININWNPEAEPGRIGKIIDEILTNSRYPNDKERWFRAVGHAFMAYNRIGKMCVVEGESGTGKSTLTAILKRVFNYSNLPTTVINKNERFTLHALVDKDINIDDDINNGILKGIGTLSKITTGEGFEVELKGLNKTINPGNKETPRLFANGNTLPPVFGEGFERRLLLIHANNKIQYEDRDEMLSNDIEMGLYDKDGLEWFVHHAINIYWDKINEPITSMEDEAKMKEDYEFKSYPMLKAIEAMFEDDYSGIENISVREVNAWIKAWHIWAFKEGKISKEHRKPSIKQISQAMNKAGFNKRNFNEGEGVYSFKYEDIKLTDKGFLSLIRPYYNMLTNKKEK